MDLRTDKIAGVLLAAGASRRMGTLKQLLPWGEHSVLEQCLDAFRAADVAPITVVLGFEAPKIRATLAKAFDAPDVRLVVNDRHGDGMLTSVQRGLRDAEAAGGDAVVLGLVDQPFVPGTVYRQLVSAYRASDRPIVIPQVGPRRGHPIVLSLELAEAVQAMPPDGGGLRAFLRARDEDVLLVPLDAEEVLRDMDVPEQYRRERDAWLESRSA